MTASLRKIFVIAGPTAVGKTQLAANVARRTGAEILGADALQVVEGLDILTAKPSAALRAEVPHHLIDVFVPTEEVNAARYVRLAKKALDQIEARGKVALIVGGTGLYLHALLHGFSPLPPKQSSLREDLERLRLDDLQRLLRALRAETAQVVDYDNPRRLTRALEVELSNTQPHSRAFMHSAEAYNSQILGGIFLTCERSVLARRVEKRIAAMFQTGVVEEFCDWTLTEHRFPASKAIGYAQLADLVAGKISLKACKELIRLATCDYAKRQIVWFNKYGGLPPMNISDEDDFKLCEEAIVRTILERSRQFSS